MRRVRATIVVVGKQEVFHIQGVFLTLGIQHVMACVILPSVACLAVPYFSTLSHKQYDFGENNVLNMKCLF
jgi:hypothetical protein